MAHNRQFLNSQVTGLGPSAGTRRGQGRAGEGAPGCHLLLHVLPPTPDPWSHSLAPHLRPLSPGLDLAGVGEGVISVLVEGASCLQRHFPLSKVNNQTGN